MSSTNQHNTAHLQAAFAAWRTANPAASPRERVQALRKMQAPLWRGGHAAKQEGQAALKAA